MAISCAAIDDISAWLLLAVLTAMVRSAQSWQHFAATLLLLVAFVAVMLGPIRRAASFFESRYQENGAGMEFISSLILFMLAASWTTERLGVHALFGAFLAGVVMPRHSELSRELSQKFEALIVVLLLPIYFALTGLRSSIFLITGAKMWLYCAVIIVLAVVGKLGGSMFSARLNGMTWRESAAVGILMNTRGLVELVILNIGLDLGILSPALFSIMVLMALVTTLMTTPLLRWVYPQPITSA